MISSDAVTLNCLMQIYSYLIWIKRLFGNTAERLRNSPREENTKRKSFQPTYLPPLTQTDWPLTSPSAQGQTHLETNHKQARGGSAADGREGRRSPLCRPRWWCGRRCGRHRRRRTRWRRACWPAASCVWWPGRSERHGLWHCRWAAPFEKHTKTTNPSMSVTLTSNKSWFHTRLNELNSYLCTRCGDHHFCNLHVRFDL